VLGLIDRDALLDVLVHLFDLMRRQVGLAEVVKNDREVVLELVLADHCNGIVVHRHDCPKSVDLLGELGVAVFHDKDQWPHADREDLSKNMHAVLCELNEVVLSILLHQLVDLRIKVEESIIEHLENLAENIRKLMADRLAEIRSLEQVLGLDQQGLNDLQRLLQLRHVDSTCIKVLLRE